MAGFIAEGMDEAVPGLSVPMLLMGTPCSLMLMMRGTAPCILRAPST
jgi:hypothetical protein